MVLNLAVLFLVLSLFFFWQSWLRRRKSGLPAGRIIYADTGRWGRVDKPLYTHELHLTGKPDYLVESGSSIIPVEVKSTFVKHAPYDSHIYQLAAYCMLVHKVYKNRPPYGILHYSNRTFAVDYTDVMEETIIELLNQMRSNARRREVNRSHDSQTRCLGCGYRSICDQALK